MGRAMVRNAVVVAAVLLSGLLAGETGAAFRNPDGVAVIIGNRAYKYDVPQVTYAHRDAEAFRRYVVDVLGFDPENVIHEKDADKATMERVFGNKDNLTGSNFWRLLHPDGLSDVVVFYSGHGIPGLNDKRGYLLPVNAHPDSAELNGYPIDMLYDNLVKLKEQQAVRSVHVFLDACFSGDSGGGRLIASVSAIRVAPLSEAAGLEKLTILTAASGKEVASWDKDAKHGLFTHHLLNALYGGGDADANGEVTAVEAKAYLDRHMTRAARRTFGRVQNADLRGEATAVLARAVGGMFPVRPAIGLVRGVGEHRGRPAGSGETEKSLLGPAREVGEHFRDCPECPEMVVVPAGRFQMGDLSRKGYPERPVHEVTISDSFAVGRYEVTRGEFARFVEATGYDTGNICAIWSEEGKLVDKRKRADWRWHDPGFSQTDRHPVTCVSWHDAQAYVQWVSRQTGKPYRLLSEAEWEYVARAGTTTEYWWGNTASHDYANYGAVWFVEADKGFTVTDKFFMGLATGADHWMTTAPVGSFAANAFGVFDTAGNVSEWVEDCWNEDYRGGAPTDGSAWTSGACSLRGLRGGSWNDDPMALRSATRDWIESGLRYNNNGFRVARTLTP